ncbi:hypothetical protein [Oricola thermophila]|uniref:GlsB/YeaQ/YmgE family stress response membrane protein n=1 Tax=Oricola thermophila TaxID=2742145 RepID=A0A6N1VGS3_9HYPH|nr:hypothetical protein [Oricola thermophila]QKV19988.1 hypothetical protein HTY61_16770 [Oricola thermophila]
MGRWTEIAQIALAGALTGFLIGPDSLDQFFGLSISNPAALNVIVGAAAGLVLGFLATLSKKQAE